MARRVGIRSDLPTTPALAMGAASLTALELTAAYTALARLGSAVQPRLITRVEDADGDVIWQPQAEPREVMDSAAAFIVTHMLQDAVSRGTSAFVRRAGYVGTVAGKSGGTRDGSDAWFIGYTPKYVGTVWIGFDRPRQIVAGASGGALAAPVWAHMMSALEPREMPWPVPSKVIEHQIDPATGAVLARGCTLQDGEPRKELFVREHEPFSVCPAGKPKAGNAGKLRRMAGFFGRSASRAERWLTRHFGSEVPQQPPPEENYLGAPRLPKAGDATRQ
jgi:penicillin-binding protein 1A